MSEQDDEVDDSHPQVANTATDEFPIKRRVSFQEGGPIVRPAATELVPVAEENDSPQLVTEYNDAENNDSENNDEFIVARSRSKSEVAPSVIQRFALTRERKWSVTIASLVAAIPGFLLGLTLGYPSNAILDLTGEATELPEEFFFNDRTISLFAAMSAIGAIFGGPIGGWIADRWGRKFSLMFCGVPFLMGYLILSYAHYTSEVLLFNVLLMSGRFLAGIGMGWGSSVCPVYTGEMCSPKLRGIYGNLFAVFLTTGVLFNYALGAIDNFRYYYISLVAVGIVAVFEVLMLQLPETPRWLMSKGYTEKAEDVLLWLRGKKIGTKKEIDEMKKSLAEKKRNVWRLFLKRSVITPVVYVLIIFAIQQSGGINAITPFVGIILRDAGVSSPRTISIFSVGIPGLIFLVVAIILVDFTGRKFLLAVSGTGQFLAVAMLGIHAFITRPSLCGPSLETACNPQFQYLAIFSIIFFIISFTVGYNSIPYVLLAELLPLSVRGKASGLASSLSWSCAAVFLLFFFDFTALITPWFTFWFISLLNISTVLFIIIFVPETKGKQLGELETLFKRKPDVVEAIL